MLFTVNILQLREDRKLLKRHLAVVLDIYTPMFSEIVRGERIAKREQKVAISKSRSGNESGHRK